MALSGNTSSPLYQEIALILQGQIERGELKPGQKLAGERQLARDFGVSPVTMSRALTELSNRGLLARTPGAGTYVLEKADIPIPQPLSHVDIVVDTSPISQPYANHYMGPVMSGVQEVAATHGCGIRFVNDGGERLRPADIRANQGLLMLGPLADRLDQATALAKIRPVVACGVRWGHAQVTCVDSDNVAAAMQVVHYLVRLGHRELVLITSPPNRNDTLDRIAGYRQAVLENGLLHSADRVLITDDPSVMGSPAQAQFDDMMTTRSTPTAIFVTEYPLALQVIARVRELGLHVPNDVSVVGFDDPVSAAYLSPPLTTVHQPLRDMGRRSAELLLQVMEKGPGYYGQELFPCTLMVRGSCRSTNHD